MKIPYTNFAQITQTIRPDLHEALDDVLTSGRYILGPSLTKYEDSIAQLLGVKHVLGVASGTCALHLVLRELGVGPGDEVLTVPNSFIASAASIALVGGTPRFVDVDEDMNISPAAIEAAITPRTRALIPVHLTGRVARMDEVMKIAKKHGLAVLEDCAQAIGAARNGLSAGSWGDAAAFSCHPLKNLFAYGDSGMIATNDDALNERVKMARSHGMPNREQCDFWSHNCRMDELQAALLLVNLKKFSEWTDERRRLAKRYNSLLADVSIVPEEGPGEFHSYQTYMIRVDRRDELQAFLNERGVEALTHYKVSLHLQPAAANLGYKKGDFPVAEKLASTILSLPLYPGLEESSQDYVSSLIHEFFGKK